MKTYSLPHLRNLQQIDKKKCIAFHFMSAASWNNHKQMDMLYHPAIVRVRACVYKLTPTGWQ